MNPAFLFYVREQFYTILCLHWIKPMDHLHVIICKHSIYIYIIHCMYFFNYSSYSSQKSPCTHTWSLNTKASVVGTLKPKIKPFLSRAYTPSLKITPTPIDIYPQHMEIFTSLYLSTKFFVGKFCVWKIPEEVLRISNYGIRSSYIRVIIEVPKAWIIIFILK